MNLGMGHKHLVHSKTQTQAHRDTPRPHLSYPVPILHLLLPVSLEQPPCGPIFSSFSSKLFSRCENGLPLIHSCGPFQGPSSYHSGGPHQGSASPAKHSQSISTTHCKGNELNSHVWGVAPRLHFFFVGRACCGLGKC